MRTLCVAINPIPDSLSCVRSVRIVLVLLGVAIALGLTVFREELSPHYRQIVEFGSIPLVSVVFTYSHIWLALWMTFYPLEFFGCCKPYIGWQGIVPSKAAESKAEGHALPTKLASAQPSRCADVLCCALCSGRQSGGFDDQKADQTGGRVRSIGPPPRRCRARARPQRTDVRPRHMHSTAAVLCRAVLCPASDLSVRVCACAVVT
jgi:hypothetical protein